MRKRGIMLVAAVTTLTALGIEPVMTQAQQVTQPEGATSGTQAVGITPGGELQEVTVTAERVSENIQQAPATIMAYDSKAIELLQINTPMDLEQVTPGVTYTTVNGGPHLDMRGLGTTASGPWQEGAVAFYIDGVYLNQASYSNILLNNLERITVLEGPQGTLFGRNANGGVVSFETKEPQQAPHMDVSAGYGNYNTFDGNLYATTGVTRNLAADIAISADDQLDGWGTNFYNGDPAHIGHDFSARSKWVLNASDTTKFTLIGDYSKESTPDAGLEVTRGIYPFSTVGPAHVGGFYDIYDPTNPYSDIVSQGVSLKAQHDFAWAQIWSLSAVRSGKDTENTPYSGFVPPYLPLTPAVGQLSGLKIQATVDEFDRTFSQEFQITSLDSSRVKWVGGVYLYFNTAGNIFKNNDSTKPPTGQVNIDTSDWQVTRSYSGYFQGTVPIFSTDTRLTAGIRYTDDQRSIEGPGNFENTVTNQSVYSPVPGQSPADNPTPSGTWTKATYKAGLDHNFTHDVLGYFTWSTGFQSAYYNINSPQAAPVEPEYITAYEVGLKSDWLDHRLRLNTSVFDYYLTNLVVTQIVDGVQFQTNAAKAQSKGIDADLSVIPIQNLSLTAGIEDLDAKYTNYPNAVGYALNAAETGFVTATIDATGSPLQDSEHFMETVTASYLFPISKGDFSIVSTLAHHSGVHYDLQNLNVQPSYYKLDASLIWTAPDGRWEVTLWGNNLTDAEIADFVPSNTIMQYSIEAPRTFGFRVTYHTD